MESPLKLETLDTTYVSLAALIRHLREKEFRGRLHVVLEDYEADVSLDGSGSPSVWERDLSSGREASGEEAQQRLLVRALEPGGLITIFEGTPDTNAIDEDQADKSTGGDSLDKPDSSQLVKETAEIIAAVERAVQSTGVVFLRVFRLARVELGDDYPFIDPTVGVFEYVDGKVVLTATQPRTMFKQALVECLKRVVDKVARQNGEAQFRERVAVELATAARHQTGGLGEFQSQLDRIAGTRVL